ncbi:MAG: DUF6089 family protein [Bacteroidota bacterium]|nr:DUF6089 family protein [Bacteroidota bacterium]
MRKNLGLFIIVIALMFSGNKANSQDWELGVSLGASEYLGDLTYSHVTWSESKFNLGGIYRYYFNPRLNFKAAVFYGNIEGSDVNKEVGSGGAYTRNLSFKSHILEGTAQVEFNILPYITGNKLRNWAPYVFTGISVYNFNPKGELNGTWYELQPLGTEGQGLAGSTQAPYDLTQISIPYGFGIKYSFKRPTNSSALNLYLWNIGVFVQQNKTFNDHLDDVGGTYPDYSKLDGGTNGIVAQLSDRQGEMINGQYVPVRAVGSNRGNPDADDMYMWLGFTITKTFRKNTCFCF